MSTETQSNEPSGLTEEDLETLGKLARGETTPNALSEATATEVESSSGLSFPWRLHDGRSGVTLEMCNAVRCAAADGLSYARISELFDFLSGRDHARRHAIGECRHTDDVPPIENGRLPGPPEGTISPAECMDLRRRWNRDEFDTYADAGKWLGRAESAAWRHINGECSHG